MADFTNYYEVPMNRALNACNDRIKHIDEVLMPLAKECLEREKRDLSQRLFRSIRFSWTWHFRKWFTKEGDLMLWAMDNPGHLLGMFEGFECGYVISAIEDIRQQIANVQMNCERIAGIPALAGMPTSRAILKQRVHGYLFAADPWDNIQSHLEPWAKEVETEVGDA